MSTITQLGVELIAEAIKTKKVSAVEVTKAFLQKIEAEDKKINSFISVNEQAVKEAEAIGGIL